MYELKLVSGGRWARKAKVMNGIDTQFDSIVANVRLICHRMKTDSRLYLSRSQLHICLYRSSFVRFVFCWFSWHVSKTDNMQMFRWNCLGLVDCMRRSKQKFENFENGHQQTNNRLESTTRPRLLMAGSNTVDKWNLRFSVFLKWLNPTRVSVSKNFVQTGDGSVSMNKGNGCPCFIQLDGSPSHHKPSTIITKLVFLAIAIDGDIELFKYIRRRTLSLCPTIELFRTQENENRKTISHWFGLLSPSFNN